MSPARPSPAPRGTPSPTRSLVGFLATVAFWVIALFGAFRLSWVQQNLLLPFATLQQRIAVALLGVSPSAVVVDASCTGSDAMAICFGAILGFPAPWKSRLRAVGWGFVLITALNTLRIGTVSMVAHDRQTFELLHVYLWPGVIVIAAVVYVFRWMKSVPPGAGSGPPMPTVEGANESIDVPHGGAQGWGIARSSPAWFVGVTTVLVTAYYAATPWLFSSSLLQRGAEWSAAVARTVMAGLGVSAQVNGTVLIADSRAWLISPECILTPLIPVYAATAVCWPASPAKRAVALALGVPVFMLLGVGRLLVLAVPGSMTAHTILMHAFYQFVVAFLLIVIVLRWTSVDADIGRDPWWHRAANGLLAGGVAAIAGGITTSTVLRALAAPAGTLTPHLGHGYADPQGALLILPAFQVGLFVALWSASGQSLRSARLATGLLILATQQVVVAVVLGEMFGHTGAEAPIVAIRLIAVLAPSALAWALQLDRSPLPDFFPTADPVQTT